MSWQFAFRCVAIVVALFAGGLSLSAIIWPDIFKADPIQVVACLAISVVLHQAVDFVQHM